MSHKTSIMLYVNEMVKRQQDDKTACAPSLLQWPPQNWQVPGHLILARKCPPSRHRRLTARDGEFPWLWKVPGAKQAAGDCSVARRQTVALTDTRGAASWSAAVSTGTSTSDTAWRLHWTCRTSVGNDAPYANITLIKKHSNIVTGMNKM